MAKILERQARPRPGVREQWALPAVSTLGNLGVLMDPVAIGFLAHAVGLEDAFFFLAMLVVVEMVIAGYVYRTMKV